MRRHLCIRAGRRKITLTLNLLDLFAQARKNCLLVTDSIPVLQSRGKVLFLVESTGDICLIVVLPFRTLSLGMENND